VKDCPVKTSNWNGICRPCDENCNKCEGIANTCIECTYSYYILFFGACFLQCSNETQVVGNDCLECDPSCQTCNGIRPYQCTGCWGEYELYLGTCKKSLNEQENSSSFTVVIIFSVIITVCLIYVGYKAEQKRKYVLQGDEDGYSNHPKKANKQHNIEMDEDVNYENKNILQQMIVDPFGESTNNKTLYF
jgi:hypothetical protein